MPHSLDLIRFDRGYSLLCARYFLYFLPAYDSRSWTVRWGMHKI